MSQGSRLSFLLFDTAVHVPYETVYHGAHALAVDSIVMEGLKSMYSKRLRFGRGTYVSRCFDVARQFATHD